MFLRVHSVSVHAVVTGALLRTPQPVLVGCPNFRRSICRACGLCNTSCLTARGRQSPASIVCFLCRNLTYIIRSGKAYAFVLPGVGPTNCYPRICFSGAVACMLLEAGWLVGVMSRSLQQSSKRSCQPARGRQCALGSEASA